MAGENPNPNEEDVKSNPNEGGEESPVTREELDTLKNSVSNIEKGVQKFFSINGQQEAENEEEAGTVSESTPSVSPVVKSLYLEKKPELEEVWDEVEQEAKDLGQDPIEYYESKKGWQLEAKARVEAKKAKEETKDSIDSPSGVISKDIVVDFDKIKPEQISKLDSEQRENYRAHLRNKEGGIQIIRSQG